MFFSFQFCTTLDYFSINKKKLSFIKGDSKGLCSPLLTPCEKTVRIRVRGGDDIEVDAEQILIEKQQNSAVDKPILTGNKKFFILVDSFLLGFCTQQKGKVRVNRFFKI